MRFDTPRRSINQADLVPAEPNPLGEYRRFGEFEAACRAFGDEVNTRPHRVARRPQAEALAEERQRPHPVVKTP